MRKRKVGQRAKFERGEIYLASLVLVDSLFFSYALEEREGGRPPLIGGGVSGAAGTRKLNVVCKKLKA